MNNTIPVVFIGDPEESNDFFSSVFLNYRGFKLYTVPPARAADNDLYQEMQRSYPNFIVGPGTAGCSLAHSQAHNIIKDHIENQGIETVTGMKSFDGALFMGGGLVFESDAKLSSYGRSHFFQFLDDINKSSFKLMQLGCLKSTSGREGQKINWGNSIRNAFLSNVLHDFEEDLLEKFNIKPKIVPGWIGGSHAYFINLDAIEILAMNKIGFFNAIDDYFRVISWNTSWVGRSRQNFFVQAETKSLIEDLGR